MPVITLSYDLESKGNADVINITPAVEQAVGRSELTDGTLTVFCQSSTSAVTTIEYETGCISDLRRMFDAVASQKQSYAHNARWGDGNGHSHVRAALLGPSITIPFVDKQLTLGTWQQVIFIDFDNRPRSRRLVFQVMGE